jgi:hypothetical protein
VVGRRLLLTLGVLGAGWLAAGLALAQAVALGASVDRTSIRVNESFTYILRAEGQLSGQFDPSALARDFDILETSRSTRVQIVNGRASQVAEWVVVLMPRRPGHYELPPATLNGVQSNAVEIDVLPAQSSGDTGDIFIEVELDRPVNYVQAQTIYTLRLFVGIGTGRATLTPPLVEGGEAIVEKLGEDSDYETRRGNRSYNVHERRYAIFPQNAGRLEIGPSVYEAVVYPASGRQRQYRLSSDVVTLEVKPAVAPPATHPGAVWLPATDLRIEEAWSDASAVFEQGVPKTRTLTVVAQGVLDTQLPEIAVAATPGLRQYADQPQLSREFVAQGIEARRSERFAVIAQQPGRLDLTPVEMPWWNVATERWEIARLPATTIDVMPSAAVAVTPTPGGPVAEGQATATTETGPGFWPWLSLALGVGWLATIAAWRLRARADHQRVARNAAARAPSESSLARQIKAACQVNDAHRSQELLLDWGRLKFAADPPASLGALASRVPGPLAAEIEALEAALYGPDAGGWRGERLFQAFKAARPQLGVVAGDEPDPLAPLYR